MPEAYYENGAVFILKRELVGDKWNYGDKTVAYIMDKKSSLDIDTIDGFKFAEYLMDKQSGGCCE